MKQAGLFIALLFCTASIYAQATWNPSVNMNTNGYSDSFDRTVVRTKSNVVYYVMNHSGIASGASSLKVYKGNSANPTAFTEMDAAHEPTDSSRIIGVDCRLNDSTGIISIGYQLTSPLEMRYITYNTATDTFGTFETVSTVNHAPGLRYLSKVALALDANGVPHVTFGGDNEGLFYSNRIGGVWSAKFSLSSNIDDMHPSLTFGTDGVLHLAWYNFDGNRAIFYRERSAGGTWSATETVDNSVGSVGDKVDQSPCIALSASNLPLILYHEQADTAAYVIIKQRNVVNTYVDVSPTPAHSAQGHDWSISVDWTGNWTIAGHGNPNAFPIEPVTMSRANSTGIWSGLTALLNDGKTHDGSTSLRYDVVWPGDQSHIDMAYHDENSSPDAWYFDATIPGPTQDGSLPAATLSTNFVTFQNQVVGTTSSPQTVTVTSSGGTALSISNIAPPTAFSESDNCSTLLAQGTSCQITISFSPLTTGLFSGNLMIADNASNSPQGVSLSGTGVSLGQSISGTISPTAGGSGATVTLSGAANATTTANSSGAYTFTGLASGSYTITPSNTGYTFSPPSQTVTLSATNLTAVNFTATSASLTAIATDTIISRDQGSASLTVTSPSFSTRLANELFLAFISTDVQSSSGTNNTVSSVTGAGLTWALVVRTNSQRGTSEIWRAFAPSALTNVSVTATLSLPAESSMTVMSFSGVNTSGTNGSGAIGATGSGSNGSGGPSASLRTTANNSWVVGVGNDWDNAITRTVGPNQIMIHSDLAPIQDTYWVQMLTTLSPGGTTVTINDTQPTSDRYNLSICEILPAQ